MHEKETRILRMMARPSPLSEYEKIYLLWGGKGPFIRIRLFFLHLPNISVVLEVVSHMEPTFVRAEF